MHNLELWREGERETQRERETERERDRQTNRQLEKRGDVFIYTYLYTYLYDLHNVVKSLFNIQVHLLHLPNSPFQVFQKVFIRQFEKRDILCYRVWRLSIRP